MRRLRLNDFRLRMVVIVSRVGDSRHGRQPLRAAHGPAERAALRAHTYSSHSPHQPPAAPTSHNHAQRRRGRDCRGTRPATPFSF